jgi:hypothetical protein
VGDLTTSCLPSGDRAPGTALRAASADSAHRYQNGELRITAL